MSDDLERRLRERLRSAELPVAPEELVRRADELRAEPPPRPPRIGGAVALVAVAAVALVSLLGIGVSALGGPSATSSSSIEPTASATPPTAERPSPTPNPTPTPLGPTPSLPPSPPTQPLGNLPVYSVSELLAARDAGQLGTEQVAVQGYWTNRETPHSCAAPLGPTGALELYCVNGEFGITELDEPILTVFPNGTAIAPSGPHLTPYLDENTQRDITLALFTLPPVYGQPYPPVPIVAVGHFDDPRAADCRPEALQLCRDRFVIDWLVSFEPSAVALPTPTPAPTPFPLADPPPAPFDAASCSGDVPYAFTGWTTMADLGLDFGRQTEVYAMVTRDVVQIGDWIDDPNGSGGRFRTMGQRICYGYEDDPPGIIGFTWVPGTAYQESADGHRTPLSP